MTKISANTSAMAATIHASADLPGGHKLLVVGRDSGGDTVKVELVETDGSPGLHCIVRVVITRFTTPQWYDALVEEMREDMTRAANGDDPAWSAPTWTPPYALLSHEDAVIVLGLLRQIVGPLEGSSDYEAKIARNLASHDTLEPKMAYFGLKVVLNYSHHLSADALDALQAVRSGTTA